MREDTAFEIQELGDERLKVALPFPTLSPPILTATLTLECLLFMAETCEGPRLSLSQNMLNLPLVGDGEDDEFV